MLWRVGSTSLYLLGSVHMLDLKPVFSDAERAVLQAARTFAFEANFKDAHQLHPNSLYRKGRRLGDDVDEALLYEAGQLWEALALGPLDELQKLQPWWAAFRLMSPQLERRALMVEHGVDEAVLQIARARKGELFYLESVGAGYDAYANAPLSEQIVSLSQVVRHSDEGLADVSAVAAAWHARDSGPAEAMRAKWLRRMPKASSASLGGRNRKWLPKLLRLARSGRPTVATVGVLHFLGEDGILALLAASGYSCAPV